ncbi:MAG: sulfotransferase [Longimicrobiales bacterium]
MSGPTKLIIIGAPRSGTNMLRDALCRLEGVRTWPCDEINPIWRHGFLHYPYDDFPAAWADDRTRAFVRSRFDRLAAGRPVDVLVEKTCANSLRVAYLAELLPEARFVFLHRDGVDATASAAKRWTSSVDLGYTLRKARFVPWSDLPTYGYRFLRNRLGQWVRADRRLPSWGPMTAAVAQAAASGSVAEAAAVQWRDCVMLASRDLADLPSERVLEVTYEGFVQDPVDGLRRVLDFVAESRDDADVRTAVDHVRTSRVGRGRAELLELDEGPGLARILDEPLARLGYPPLDAVPEEA